LKPPISPDTGFSTMMLVLEQHHLHGEHPIAERRGTATNAVERRQTSITVFAKERQLSDAGVRSASIVRHPPRSGHHGPFGLLQADLILLHGGVQTRYRSSKGRVCNDTYQKLHITLTWTSRSACSSTRNVVGLLSRDGVFAYRRVGDYEHRWCRIEFGRQ
jgi:hypothetical protein